MSITLSTSFIQRQALSRAKDVRDDRRATNSEVSEFILMANNLLKGQGIDEVSDIDVYTTTSHLDNGNLILLDTHDGSTCLTA